MKFNYYYKSILNILYVISFKVILLNNIFCIKIKNMKINQFKTINRFTFINLKRKRINNSQNKTCYDKKNSIKVNNLH